MAHVLVWRQLDERQGHLDEVITFWLKEGRGAFMHAAARLPPLRYWLQVHRGNTRAIAKYTAIGFADMRHDRPLYRELTGGGAAAGHVPMRAEQLELAAVAAMARAGAFDVHVFEAGARLSDVACEVLVEQLRLRHAKYADTPQLARAGRSQALPIPL